MRVAPETARFFGQSLYDMRNLTGLEPLVDNPQDRPGYLIDMLELLMSPELATYGVVEISGVSLLQPGGRGMPALVIHATDQHWQLGTQMRYQFDGKAVAHRG